MRYLRIAIFHASLPSPERKIGGVEAAVHRLASTLADNPAVEVTVFSSDRKPNGARYNHRRIFPWALQNRLARLLLLPIFLNFLDFRQFDVVHTHGDDWFWLWRRLPTVRTMHGSALREAQSASRLSRKVLQYCVYPLEQLSVRLATRSVAVGADTKRLYGCHEIVGNSVDLDRFKVGRKAPFPLVVFIGLWNGRKRGGYAFRTFVDRVLPLFPTAQLHMVSDTAESHPNVVLHSHPDDAALAAILARAWLFFYPSLYEGFGIPYIEAMASGTAILTSPNAGAFEILENGKYGAICGDDALADRLLEMLAEPAHRDAFACGGVDRAAMFGADAIAACYLKIYGELARPC